MVGSSGPEPGPLPEGRAFLLEQLGAIAPCPDRWVGSMAAIPLPLSRSEEPEPFGMDHSTGFWRRISDPSARFPCGRLIQTGSSGYRPSFITAGSTTRPSPKPSSSP